MSELSYEERVGVAGARKRKLRRMRITKPPNAVIDVTGGGGAGYVILLTWERSDGLFIDGYRIFRDGVLIRTVTPDTIQSNLEVSDALGSEYAETTFVYKLYAFNSFGGKSDEVIFSITTPP